MQLGAVHVMRDTTWKASTERLLHAQQRGATLEGRLRETEARLQAGGANALADPASFGRRPAAEAFLRGTGLEIGALHQPLPLPPGARARYVDRMAVPDLRRHYPELRDCPLVDVEIVADGRTLDGIPDGSQDFVVANHFIEHVDDPFAALRRHLGVLRSGGIYFLALPDKRFTFDAARPTTPLAHLVRDHEEGPAWSRAGHFEEWVRLVRKIDDPEAAAAKSRRLSAEDYSIHFHVWTQAEMLEMLAALRSRYDARFEIELASRSGHECLFVLRKA